MADHAELSSFYTRPNVNLLFSLNNLYRKLNAPVSEKKIMRK